MTLDETRAMIASLRRLADLHRKDAEMAAGACMRKAAQLTVDADALEAQIAAIPEPVRERCIADIDAIAAHGITKLGADVPTVTFNGAKRRPNWARGAP